MQTSLVGFVLGALVLHCMPRALVSSAFFPQVLIGLILIVVIFGLFLPRVRYLKHAVLLVLAALLSALYTAFVIQAHIQSQVTEPDTGQIKTVTGYICSIPQLTQFGQSFHFCSTEGRLLARHSMAPVRVEQGLCYSMMVRLKSPRSTYNPASSSYERYLFAKRLVGMARITSYESVQCSLQERGLSLITQLRWILANKLDAALDSMDSVGLVRALVLGDRGAITADQNQALTHSGTQHLLAISGLHVGLVLWFVFFAAGKLGLKAYAPVIVVSAGLVYTALVGFSPSAQRALIMCLCAMAVFSGRLPSRLYLVYLLALSLVLLLDPLAPLQLGFWFSFFAVAVLLLVYSNVPWLRQQGVLVNLFILQCVLLLCMAPLQAHFSMPFSWFSLPANLVAIPWVSIVALPGAIFSTVLMFVSPDLANFGFVCIDRVLNALLAFLESSLALKPTVLVHLQWWHVVLVECLLLNALVLAQSRVLFTFVIAFVAVWLATFFDALEEGVTQEGVAQEVRQDRIRVLDVGQGLSVVIEGAEQTWVYDTGPSFERYSSAKSTLMPALYEGSRVARIDGLIVSHGDGDHAGDASWVYGHFEPATVWLGEPERANTHLASQASQCVRGMNSRRAMFNIEVLWPLDEEQDPSVSSNQRSCVVRVQFQKFSVLVMGDLEGQGEAEFVRWYRNRGRAEMLKAEVLIAGHHGAKKATSSALLKFVRPEYVVFSSGFANRFRHPAEPVLDRVARFDARALVTAVSGGMEFFINEQGVLDVDETRMASDRYWIRP